MYNHASQTNETFHWHMPDCLRVFVNVRDKWNVYYQGPFFTDMF